MNQQVNILIAVARWHDAMRVKVLERKKKPSKDDLRSARRHWLNTNKARGAALCLSAMDSDSGNIRFAVKEAA